MSICRKILILKWEGEKQIEGLSVAEYRYIFVWSFALLFIKLYIYIF